MDFPQVTDDSKIFDHQNQEYFYGPNRIRSSLGEEIPHLIARKGPESQTGCCNFWRLCLQEKVTTVLTVAKDIGSSRFGGDCLRYFPKNKDDKVTYMNDMF